jgi:hypothetical protein
MGITIDATDVPGTAWPSYKGLDTHFTRRHHFATVGESEIRSNLGGRDIEVLMWVHESSGGPLVSQFDTAQKLVDWLEDTLTPLLATHYGPLTITSSGGTIFSFEDVTFTSWEPTSVEGGLMTPMLDVGKCLEPGCTTDVYWIELLLRFRQLLVA